MCSLVPLWNLHNTRVGKPRDVLDAEGFADELGGGSSIDDLGTPIAEAFAAGSELERPHGTIVPSEKLGVAEDACSDPSLATSQSGNSLVKCKPLSQQQGCVPQEAERAHSIGLRCIDEALVGGGGVAGLWASRGILAVSAALYGTDTPFVKLLEARFSPSFLTALRFSLATLPLIPFLMRLNRGVFCAGIEVRTTTLLGYHLSGSIFFVV